MPLIVVTGKPSSGKTTVTRRFCEYLRSKGIDQVEVVSDDRNASFSRSQCKDSNKEREHRLVLKSEIQRLVSKHHLIICDSLNYIKGFRFELFCIAKLAQTTYAVVYCDANENTCMWLNSQKDEAERYERNDIAELIARFEEPLATNRWDSPLFTIKIGIHDGASSVGDISSERSMRLFGPKEVQLPLVDVYSSLVEGKSLTANLSTQTALYMPADFLHVVDRATQEIINSVIQQQRTALPGDTFVVPNCTLNEDKVLFTRQRSLAELSRLRRQFINYMRMHPVKDMNKIAPLFVDYLNANS